ncbi:MAG: VOC family protein [Myxococcales bacterium]|nr:VOC family protein [Myxococcales bacterium]
MASAAGRFVRWDLMAGDGEAAEAFYSALFGWSIEEQAMGGFTMRTIRCAGETLGAIVPLDAAVMPSHWMTYVAVDDIEAAGERAVAAGGAVCVPPTMIPGLGRFGVFEDPCGGYFSPVELLEAPALHARPAAGRFCWSQLLCSDVAKVAPFYRAVFGWEMAPMPGQAAPTWVVSLDGAPVASVMQKPPVVEARDAWLPYVAVADCGASEAQARALGAKVWVASTKLPGMGVFAVLADPVGAQVALWEDAGEG